MWFARQALRRPNTLAVLAVHLLLFSVAAVAQPGLPAPRVFPEVRIACGAATNERAAVQGVLDQAPLSALLVSLMILAFLGCWRSVVVVATSILLAVVAGVAGLQLLEPSLEQSFHLKTLGGLALAIVLLAHGATVAMENIHRHRAMGVPLKAAIRLGTDQISVPALAATLTSCIIFLPAVLSGPSFVPLALAVIIPMLASYVLSRTLVPALARQIFAREKRGPQAGASAWGRLNARRDRLFAGFQGVYGRTLSAVLARRGIVLGTVAALVACAATYARWDLCYEGDPRLVQGLLALTLVYLLLAVFFQSWLDPFVIMTVIPGVLVGIFCMLALTDTSLDVESFTGSVMAMGIAVSNAILLVTFANAVRIERGASALEAAQEAGRTRLRPILMSELMLSIAMMPLAWGQGGAAIAPLGRAVIGGLLASSFVTLFLVPTVYSLLRHFPSRPSKPSAA